jgi:protein-S-isoprenylcysteine O-methyltransferase Ste14
MMSLLYCLVLGPLAAGSPNNAETAFVLVAFALLVALSLAFYVMHRFYPDSNWRTAGTCVISAASALWLLMGVMVWTLRFT